MSKPKKRGREPERVKAETKPFLDIPIDEAVKIIKGMKVATYYRVASALGVKVGVAKRLVDELARKGIVEYVVGVGRERVFKPVIEERVEAA